MTQRSVQHLQQAVAPTAGSTLSRAPPSTRAISPHTCRPGALDGCRCLEKRLLPNFVHCTIIQQSATSTGNVGCPSDSPQSLDTGQPIEIAQQSGMTRTGMTLEL